MWIVKLVSSRSIRPVHLTDSWASYAVLDQRKQRRRAKAVIVKDRSKVTGPSETIVKANKKASKASIPEEYSKYRQTNDASQTVEIGRKRKTKGSRDPESNAANAVQPEYAGQDGFTFEVAKKKKRSSDVQRNLKALRDASKGNRDGNKRKRHDPLERAANILPVGRVTVSCYTRDMLDL